MRLIDADAAMNAFMDESTGHESEKAFSCHDIDRVIGERPTVEAVVLPCKPGDTVFVFWRLAGPDICSKCPDFCWGGMGDSHACGKTEDGFRSAECIEIQEWVADFKMILHWIGYEEFGETVFSTRAEAEAVLAKRRNEHET